MDDLSIRLRKLREFIQYTQENLSYELGMTQSAYHKLEMGKTRLDLRRLNQLAVFYNLTIADLLYRDLPELYSHLLSIKKIKN